MCAQSLISSLVTKTQERFDLMFDEHTFKHFLYETIVRE